MTRTKPRSQVVHTFPTTTPNTGVEITVGFTGKSHERSAAYWLHVTPIEVEQFADHQIRKFRMFSGRRKCLEAVNRANSRVFERHCDNVRRECANKEPALMDIVNVVLAEENLTLAPTEENTACPI
jgi:hypothetical protein